MLEEREKLITPNGVTLLCISGNMGAGKSNFANEFGESLKKRGFVPIYWNQDWNQASRAERENIRANTLVANPNINSLNLSKAIYFESYHWNDVISQLEAMQNRRSINQLRLYQKTTGERDFEVSLRFDDSSKYAIIYDGGWGMHQPVRGFMNEVIVIEADQEVRFQRMAKRALALKKPFILSKERFLELDEFTTWYLNQNRDSSDIRIDNNDFTNRKIIT